MKREAVFLLYLLRETENEGRRKIAPVLSFSK